MNLLMNSEKFTIELSERNLKIEFIPDYVLEELKKKVNEAIVYWDNTKFAYWIIDIKIEDWGFVICYFDNIHKYTRLEPYYIR